MLSGIRGLLVLALAVTCGLASARITSLEAYNEAVDEQGNLRPAYTRFAAQTGHITYPVSTDTVGHLLNSPMQDKIKILPIPLVLSGADYRLLQKGAQQRAQALMEFFADVVIGDGKIIERSGLLSRSQISGLFKTDRQTVSLDTLRAVWHSKRREDINFIFGPDVVRNPQGHFVVLEDNVGTVGGLGDLAATHQSFFSQTGDQTSLQPPLIAAVEQFLSDIPRENWGEEAIVLYHENGEEEPASLKTSIKPEDDEDKRIAKAVKGLGLKILKYSDVKDANDKFAELAAGRYKKIINLGDIQNMGLGYTELNTMMEAYRDGKFQLFLSPGVGFLSTKALLPFVDDFVRIYLKEEPLLRSQPTKLVSSPQDLAQPGNWVVKKADGLQGEEVYVLSNLTEMGRAALATNIQAWVAFSNLKDNQSIPWFIMQEYVEPSYVPAEMPTSWVKFNVDFRPHVFVTGGKSQPPAIWGRANWKLPGFLNNVSQNAMELVVTSDDLCERSLLRRSN
jgi:uncharacterized circularly permuted ATP-grasp superfamily protein